MNRQQNKHVIPYLKPHTITRTLADFFKKKAGFIKSFL